MKEEKDEDLLQEEAFEQEEEKDEDLEDLNAEDLEIDLLDTYDEMMNLADEDDDYLDLEPVEEDVVAEEEEVVEELPIPESMKKDELIDEVYRLRRMGIAKDEKEKGLIVEVDYLRKELKGARKQIVEMKYNIEDLQEEYGREREVASNCAGILRDFLFKWLTKDNQAFVKRVFKFYDYYDQTRMIYAILKYLIFDDTTYFHKAVQAWHFKMICEKIDEDAVTLPVHSMMVKLMKKYGLFQGIEH